MATWSGRLHALHIEGLADPRPSEARQRADVAVSPAQVEGASPPIRRGDEQDHVAGAGRACAPLGVAEQRRPAPRDRCPGATSSSRR